MPLVISPVQLSDWDAIASHPATYPPSDLTNPLLLSTWPVTTAAEGASRVSWSNAQQRQLSLQDKTAHLMKVIDTDADDEILALARWHYYADPVGFPAESVHLEIDAFAPRGGEESSPPEGLNFELYRAVLVDALGERAKWTKGPNWTLTTLITRSSHRCRGAGGMLVEWGCKQADADGVSAYIEASAAGLPLYLKYGFERRGVFKFDKTPFGVEGNLEVVLLEREPRKEGH